MTIDDEVAVRLFLQGLRRESGLYADGAGAPDDVRSTLSIIKALQYLDERPANDHLVDAITACRASDGGFGATAGAEPTVLDTVAALIGLVNLDPATPADVITAGLAYAGAHASTKFDHFMTIAACEECARLEAVPSASVAFFQQLLDESISQGNVVDAGIASSALLRAGVELTDEAGLIAFLLNGQDPQTGGFGAPGSVTLFGTYCVMRALALLDAPPRTLALSRYIDTLRTPLGYAATAGGPTLAGATYQVLGLIDWLRLLQGPAVRLAESGDIVGLQGWLDREGDVNLPDQRGWVPLAAAASRGQAEAVRLLLAAGADPSIRVPASDLLPVHLAAQRGHAPSVGLLLAAQPDHIRATTHVNGHTVLLQAAFYGKSGHQEIVRLVLDGRSDDERAELLAATNVRGYNAVGMQDLWHNEPMKALLLSYYPGGETGEFGRKVAQLSAECTQRTLDSVAQPSQLSERMMALITRYIDDADEGSLSEAHGLLTLPAFEIDRLAGPLLMTPLIFACTGVDTSDAKRAARRLTMVRTLLEAGADPAVLERHPMAVGAVIRASVLNNFALLQLIASYMTEAAFAAEMNVSPPINGLTAMHDAIHRGLTSPPEQLTHHLDQIEWMLARGARIDIPDNTGQTQDALARAAADDPAFDAATVGAVNAILDRYRPNTH